MAATLARAACARSVGHRGRGGSALGGLRLLRCTRRVSCAVFLYTVTRPWPLRLDGPPAVKTQLLAARGGDTRARCLRPLGWPPQSRRLGTRRLAPPALYAARLLRCVSLRSHTPVAAAARRTARRQDAAACRSWRRRSRALLAPARLATAVAAARHSAACASCAVRGASLALCFSTRSHARGRCGSTDRPPSRRSCLPLVAATLARAACARSVGHRSRGGSALGGLRLLRCTRRVSCAVFLYAATRPWPLRLDGPPAVKTQLLAARGGDARARCLRPLGWPPQSRRLGTRRLAPPALYAARLLRCVSLRSHTPVAAAARRTARRQDAAACRSWRRRSRALLAPARLATAVAAARHSAACASCAVRGASLALCFSTQSHARGRCGSTDRPPSRRSCLPLVAATLARAACARSVGHRSRGGSTLGGLRLLRCTRRVSCAVFLYAVTRPWPLRLDGPPAVKTQLLAARGGDARARCLRPLGWSPRSRRLGTRRLAPPALYAARLLRCVLNAHTPVAAAARRTARRQDAAACRSWRRRSRALLAPARLATAVAAARHSAACASCAVRGASLALCFSTRPHARGRCGSTDRPPSRRSCLPLVAATLARAACARSVGHRGRGGSALGGLRLLRCTRRVSCAVFLYTVTRPWPLRLDGPPAVKTQLLAARGGDARARCLRPLGWPPQSRRLGTRRLAPPALYAARLLRCVSLRSHTPVAAAARRTARRQDAAACRSWRRRSRALLAPARLATAVAAARHSAACASCAVRGASLALCFSTQSHARGRCGPTDRPPSRRSCLPLVAATLARAACARSVGHRSRGGSALGGLRLLRCTRRVSCAVFLYTATRPWPLRLDGPPAVKTQLLAARGGDARARCLRPLGWPPRSRRLGTRRLAPPALYAARLLRCVSLRSHTPVAAAARRTARRQDAAACRSWRRRSRALLAPARLATAVAAARHSAACASCAVRGASLALCFSTQSHARGRCGSTDRPPSRRSCLPLVAATLARAACARSVGHRSRGGSTLGGLRLLRCTRRVSCAVFLYAVTRPWPLRPDGPPAVKTRLLAARGGDARARCLRPLGWPPQSRRLGTRRLAPPALYAARLLRCVSLHGHTPVAAAARRTARRQDAAACRSWRRHSRALLAPARLATAVAAARHSAACASCAVRGASLALCFSTQPHARGRCGSTDRPPSRRSCLPLVAATLARAACARSVGHRSRGGSTLGGLRLLRCTRRVSCAVFLYAVTRPWPLRPDGPPAVKTQLLAARGGDARARCLRPLGWPPQSRRLGTRRLAPPALYAARLLRCVSLHGHTPVAAAARRTARRQDAAACRSWRRRSRALLAPARLATAVAAARHSAACASCAVRGASLALCFSTQSHARGRCGSTDRPPSRRSCLPLVAATLARAACARSVGHRSRGGSALGGLRLLRCTRRVSCAVFLYAVTRPWPLRLDGPPAVKTQLLAARGGDARARCLRPLGWPPQSRRLGTRRLAPPALYAARLLRCVSLRSHTPVAAAARRTARRQDAAACRSWRRRSRALLAPARLATAVAAARHSAACASCAVRGASLALCFSTQPHARGRCGPTDRPPSRRGCLPLVAATLARAACARSVGHRSRGGSALGGLRLLRCTRRVSCAVFLYAVTRPWLLRLDGPPAVKTQLLAARGGDARARCLRPLGWPPQSRRLGTRRLAPPALYAARLLRCVSLRSHTPVAAAARRTARRQDAAACRSWRRRSRALLAPARLATAVAAARHSAACASCAVRGASLALCFSTQPHARGRCGSTDRPPSRRSCLPLVAATLARAACARSVGHRSRGGSTLGGLRLLRCTRRVSCAVFLYAVTRPWPLRLDGPPAVKTQLLAARGGDARARCLRPLGWPPQSRRLGTRRLAPPGDCEDTQHTPVAAAARRTARRQDAAACRSWRRRSRALLAPARLATAVAAARHSAACASCAVRGASLALCFSTATRPWPLRLDGPPAVKTQLLAARGGDARARCLRPLGWPPQSRRLGTRRLAPPALYAARLLRCVSLRSHTPVAAAARRTARRQDAAACRSWRRRSRALLAPARLATAVAAARHSAACASCAVRGASLALCFSTQSHARGRCGSTDRPPSRRSCLPLVAATLARAACARSVGHRSRGGSTLGGLRLLRCTRRVSCAVFLYAVTRPWPLRPDGPPAVKTRLLAARGGDARARCLRPLGWPPQSRRLGTRRLAPPALYAARLLRCVSLHGHTPVAAAARRTARRQDAAACRSWRRRSRALLAPARLATAVAAARHSAACASCAVRGASLALCFSTQPHARGRCGSTDRPPSRRSCLPLVAATLARAACARSVGHRSRGGSTLGGLRLLRCTRRVSARQRHTPVAAAARRTARRQDAAACRSWRRRSRALLAPARLATAVAAARHSAACASCAARGASLALCFSTQSHARGRCGSTDRPPSRRSCLPLVAATLARAACARSVGHRSRGGSALGGLRLLRCTRRSCAEFLYAHTPVAAAARRTARRQDAAACRSWRRRSRALLAPARLATAVAAARHSAACASCAVRGASLALCFSTQPHARGRCGSTDRPPSRRSCLPLVAATLARAACARSVGHRSRGGSALGGLRLLRCTRRVSCAVFLYAATRPWPLRLDGPPAVKTQLLAARGGDARARCLRPLGWPPQSRRLGTRRLAPPALYAARLLRCVSLRSHTPVAAAARRTARRQDAAACRSWRRRSRALLAPARLATAVAAARHSAACASCAVNATRPRPLRLDGPPAVKTQLLAARGGDARARCLRPLGWPPQSRRLGTRRLAPPALHAARLLRCVSLRSHTPVAAAARRTARRQDAAACRSWRRRSRALLAPARLATAVAAARHSAACASCAVRGASLALCFSTQHTPVAAAARRTARRQDAAACRSWRRRSRALLAPARLATAVAAARHSAACASCAVRTPHARGRCGSTDRPPSRRSCLPLVAATLARAACARSVGHRGRGGSALGGLRLLRCTRRVSCAVFLYTVTRPWPLRLDGPPAVKTQLLAARGGDARARCLRPLGWPPQSRRLGTRRLAPPALYAARLLRCVSLRSHTPVAAAARRTARRQDAAACRSWRRRSRALLAPARLATAVAAARHSAACASCAVRGASLALCFSTQSHARGRCGPTDRPPSRRGCWPLVAATLARAACARSVGHRSRGGSALGGLRLLRCTRRVSCAVFLYAVTRPWPLRLDGPPAVKTQLLAARGGDARARCLRPLGWPPQSRRLDTRRLAPPAL